MKRISLFLPDPQIAALRKIAEEKGMTVAELIRRAIDEWLARQGKVKEVI
jgi:predicted DNA-binding ribbon-helix-helix protein